MTRYTPRRVLGRLKGEGLYLAHDCLAWAEERYLRAIRHKTWRHPDQILHAYGRVLRADWDALGLAAALAHLGSRPATILETGTAGEGASSTLIWDAYVRSFGGRCTSIDLSQSVQKAASRKCSGHTTFVCSDSISELYRLARSSPGPGYDLVYLDSLNLDWKNPGTSMAHGMPEFELVAPLVRPGGIVLVDDTPKDLSFVPEHSITAASSFALATGTLPGKGALIPESVTARSLGFEVHTWKYALLLVRSRSS